MNAFDYLEHYLKNPGGFSILILGERGTGKTRNVKEIVEQKLNKIVVVANCASFSDDTMAESALFGHTKNAFTGANSPTEGLFKKAENNFLFLDEVHNLSTRVQEKIMTALQTESSGEHQGKFRIMKLGANTPEFIKLTPIFASNLKLDKLKNKLMPDLFDRISQLVIEMQSIHESKHDVYYEFSKVWNEMKFQEFPETPNLSYFKEWLKKIPLEGNYRTLQSIAINWHQGRLILGKDKEEEIYQFVKNQFSKFHTSNTILSSNQNYNFRKGFTKKQLEKEYQTALYDWAVSEDGYGSPTQAQKGLSHSRLKKPL